MVIDEEALIAEARRLRDAGESWAGMSRALGKSVAFFKARLVPGFRERRKLDQRKRRENGFRRAEAKSYQLAEGETYDPIRLPADTRDLTARIFGDPLPGFSALDRKRASI